MRSQGSENRPPSGVDGSDDVLTIDCDRCEVRPHACSDCVVSVLLGPPEPMQWDASQRRAVDALADAGIVPRLQLVSDRRDLNARRGHRAG